MLDEEICKLRKQLNESIANGEDYSITNKLSVELDELIAKYYKQNEKQNEEQNARTIVSKTTKNYKN